MPIIAKSSPYAFSSAIDIAVHHVGVEWEPVVVVDRAMDASHDLVRFACEQSHFVPADTVASGYPGLLGPAPTAYVDQMVRFVLPLIERYFTRHPVSPARARGNFSLATKPPAQLTPDQRVPHVDTVDRLQFAAVHYLSRTNIDGTGFFRHRKTGFETIDAARLPAYRAALDPALAMLPDTGYITGASALFEQIGAVAGVFDRLVLYRAVLLHSALLTEIPAHADDPRRGRLTGNLFLQCRALV